VRTAQAEGLLMNIATITDIAWEGAQLAFRAIMAARSRKDAEGGAL
jgi:hypothetical protein